MKYLYLTLITAALTAYFSEPIRSQDTQGSYLDLDWKKVATKMPADWYGSEEAKLVAENVLLSQKDIGGWAKNKPYHHVFSESEKEKWHKKINQMTQMEPVNSGVYKWADHPVTVGELRESRKILEGVSPHFEYLEIHATTQFPGAKASSAHANEDIEECIIVKKGLMKVTIEDRSAILGAGGVVLLMPQQMHSLENVGNSNLTYYVMRYRSKKKMDLERGEVSGGSLMLNADSLTFKPSARGGGKAYFDRSTAMCERFEMHVTQLNQKGPSHKPHAHEETEIILMLSGATEMTIDGIEYQGATGDFYFMNAQSQHGVRNATDESCSYFAFKWK